MKFAVICLLVVAMTLLETASAESHNNQWGAQGMGDVLLSREIVREESKFLQIVKKQVNYQFPGTITFIKAIDQYVNGNGGYATLVSGGVGTRDVSIKLKSKRNHGFNFIIEIYGR